MFPLGKVRLKKKKYFTSSNWWENCYDTIFAGIFGLLAISQCWKLAWRVLQDCQYFCHISLCKLCHLCNEMMEHSTCHDICPVYVPVLCNSSLKGAPFHICSLSSIINNYNRTGGPSFFFPFVPAKKIVHNVTKKWGAINSRFSLSFSLFNLHLSREAQSKAISLGSPYSFLT